MESPNTAQVMPNTMPTLLLCALCDKPFTKELQHRRHMAYCRKSQGRKRLRSCQACNQSKIKCNAGTPCHQCVRKGIECVFDQRGRRERPVATTEPEKFPVPATATSIESVLAVSDLRAEGLGHDLGKDDLLGGIDQTEVVGSGTSPHMSRYSSNGDGQDSANSISSNEVFMGNSLSVATATVISIPAEEDAFMTLLNDTFDNSAKNCITDVNFQLDDYSFYPSGKDLQVSTFSPNLPPVGITPAATETSPSSEIITSGHFTKNAIKTGIQQICATMIIDMFYAYPRMMTRRETLPPFMHAFSPANDTDDGHNRLPEHLTNCMGIAQLFAARTDDTCSFVWATIRAEIRGFRNCLNTFDEYGALSALQASLLYLIIRVVEEKPQEAEDDFEMLVIYNDVCTRAVQLTTRPIHQAGDRNSDLRWKDWIFMESIRRVACVWYILGLVFHIRTGEPCYLSDHYRDILLPCTKNEWEAKTEAQWRKEHSIAGSTNALHTFGGLIDAHQHLPDAQFSERLNMWNAGIDHLGMVLNLAVRMV